MVLAYSPPQSQLFYLPAALLCLVSFSSPASAQLGGLMPSPLGWLSPWPYKCQAPIPLGQSCIEDYDCDPGDGTAAHPPQHCHVSKKVCAYGVGAGEPCNAAHACAKGLACKFNPPVMECFTLLNCDANGENCQQGPSTGKSCSWEDPSACITGEEICNNSLQTDLAAGTCVPQPTKEGEDCSGFIGGNSPCGNGMFCLMGKGTCGYGGQLGQLCPILPDRCDVTKGLNCISEAVEPFASSCQLPRRLGEHCNSGGECAKGHYCDLHDLTCKYVHQVF